MTEQSNITASAVNDLARLVALEEIRALKARYFHAVDTKDWPAIIDIFTEDARVDFGGELQYHVGHHGVTEADADPDAWVVIGGAATAKVIEQAVGSIVSVHQGHDPLITLQSADAASGRWTLYDRLEYGHEVMHGFGHYDETYRKIGGQWRIASLTLTRLRVAWEDTRRTG